MAILERAKRELDLMEVTSADIDLPVVREAVFMLLERADRQLHLVELLTMIGLADHIMIQEVGSPISGDDFFMIPNGPLPIRLFAQMWSAQLSGRIWSDRVHVTEASLELLGSGECDKLSRGQRRILEVAFQDIYERPMSDVVESLAAKCPEWPATINRFVPLSDVYVAYGASPEEATAQVADVRSHYRGSAERKG